MTHLIEQGINHHASIKFKAEISENEISLLDTISVQRGKV